MRECWTIQDVIDSNPLPQVARSWKLPAPRYSPPDDGTCNRVGLAVLSMKDHTTDEGWQIFQSLEHAGYQLWGHCLPKNSTRIPIILDISNPLTMVIQDKREWDTRPGDFRDPYARFNQVHYLKDRHDIFKLTILKDAHQRPDYHMKAADEVGCHAWIVYYNQEIVSHLAPYVRPQHLIRTWHTIDRDLVPKYVSPNEQDDKDRRRGCIISGALSSAYPLRKRLVTAIKLLPDTTYLPHPGYHRDGCCTPQYLQTLARYKVAICTASRYGYTLRKIIEATACGCMVITDLPCDEVLPKIDGNLVRVTPDITPDIMADVVKVCLDRYDPRTQSIYSRLACEWFDYRAMGIRLANDIEWMRSNYNILQG